MIEKSNSKFWYRLTQLVIVASILLVLLVIYLSIFRIDVIDNSTWRVTPDKTEYTVGDTIVVAVEARKLQNVEGDSRRYIVCDTPTGVENRFGIGEAPANRKPGENKNNVYLRIPDVIPNVPVKCAIEFNTDYGWPYEHEVKRTDKFMVNPKSVPADPTEEGLGLNSPDTDNRVLEDSPATPDIMGREVPLDQFPNQEPNPTTPENSPREPHNNPIQGLLDAVTDGAINIIRGVL